MTFQKICSNGHLNYFSLNSIKKQLAESIDNSIIQKCIVCNEYLELELSEQQRKKIWESI